MTRFDYDAVQERRLAEEHGDDVDVLPPTTTVDDDDDDDGPVLGEPKTQDELRREFYERRARRRSDRR